MNKSINYNKIFEGIISNVWVELSDQPNSYLS